MKGILLSLVLFPMLSIGLSAAEVTRDASPKSIPELKSAIEAILKETRTPGAAAMNAYLCKKGQVLTTFYRCLWPASIYVAADAFWLR